MSFFSLWNFTRRRVRRAPERAMNCPSCHHGIMLPSAFGDFCNKCEHCEYNITTSAGFQPRICSCAHCEEQALNAA